jgi:hypothetical protein
MLADNKKFVLTMVPHYQELVKEDREEHFQDHMAAGLFGKTTDGQDFFLCHGIFHVGGHQWSTTKDDVAVIQSTVVMAPYVPKNERVMKDTPFYGNRCDPLNSFKFEATSDKDSVTWEAGNRKMTCKENAYVITGEHYGLDLNVKMTR